MNIVRLKNLLLWALLLFAIQINYSQLSKTHYIPPLTAAENGNADPGDQYIYISTPSNIAVEYTIIPIGLPSSLYITGVVSNNSPKRIDLGTGYGQLFIPSISTSQVVNQRGYIIEATDLIYVSIRMNAGYSTNSNTYAQAGALVSKGLSALGTEFRIGTFTNENPQDNYLNFVSVMATEDDTQITFDDLPSGLVIKNYSGTFPITTSLNKGESYTIATNSFDSTTNKDGLIGALVKSDKAIVVNCGSANGSFHNGGGRDYGIDQIVGVDKIGSEYIFVKGDGQNEWENVLIVPNTAGTTISINGETPITITGKYYLIEGDKYSSNDNMYVKTSNPVFAYQGVGATTSEANQGMFFVPPLSCETKGNVNNIANIDYIGTTAYTGGVSIVTKKGATITINNQPLSSFATQGPFDVTGNTEYETYKVLGLTGDVSVQSDNELYCAYFNYNGAATSGSFYSGFPTAPEINFEADFVTLGNCIDNITLEAANMGAFESIEWYYDDGSGGGFIATGNTTQTLKPTFPGDGPFSTGTYYLKGITCTGDEILSDEVPVSICPDDTDNDGIIDNIDIDNDNDGILNCTESYGDQTINLSNLLSGSLPVGSYSYTGVVSTPVGDPSNNITGDANGILTSTVGSKNSLPESSTEYQLNFNKNLNIEVNANSDLTDQDEFIIQVSNQKTITLIDPDDQLLVDSNYDGVFESGITQFSSFEIHFKIKGTSLASGTATFKFVSSMVDFFSYEHKNISDTVNTSAAFKIIATCVPIDSDNDGNSNEFDNDSDNDGIPDIAEATGTLKVLLINDSNNDGLDDVFDINAIPVDTDNDNIPDYLDLDSDNDGIYDLEESGSGLPDTDFNGIIDNVNTTIGLNGWDDNAETTPDSGLVGYTIRNIDGDANFDYIDSDSDGDACFDVFEAGFTPSDTDETIIKGTGTNPSNGLITGSDGYATPNTNYSTPGIIEITTQPTDKTICELETAMLTVETNTIDSYQWQVSIDNGTLWTNIVDDLIYSNATTNELTITTTPLLYNNYKYRVVLEKTGNSCGLISNEITLTVNALPIANTVLDLENCDDLVDGDDTNEIVQNFDLESQTSTILGAQNPTDYSVTYHLSQTEADTNTGALTSPFENTSNPQTIYVRVENLITGCFVTNLNFQLIVNALPIANPVIDLVECDNLNDGDDTNGIVQNFDLESQTSTILGTQLPTDYTVSYHISAADAVSGNSPLTSPHANTLSPFSETIYVRVVNNITGCVNPHLTFNVIVNPLPVANTVSDLEDCDNLDDGNDTNGIIQTFDLESQTNTILGTQPSADYQVTYHANKADAVSGNSPLVSPHANTSNPNSQTIFVRVLNKLTGCVNSHLTFDLIVHPLPIITSPVTLKQCDNDTDGFSLFNLTEVNDEISGNAVNETFTYYLSEAEAISQTNAITNPTNFENRTVNKDIVWASIESQYGCTRVAEIQLFVSTTGIPSTYHRTFYECDDFLDENGDDNANNDKRDGITAFDFSEVDAEVRAIFPSGQQIFITYYRNEDDALAEINAISDISNYRNIGYPNSQDIYIRVDSEVDNDCLGFGAHITLNVEALPFANPVTINRQCDDDDDGLFPFDTSLVESTVLNGQTNVTVNYFDESGNALPSPLPNPFLSTSQIITIQVENSNTQSPNGPCYDETTLEFIVDKSPVAYPVSIAPVCDDESNDGIYSFDTSTIEAQLLGAQTNMEVHYYDATGTELSSPLPNPFTTNTQSILVEVVNPLNLVCTAKTTLDFIVNPLPNFQVITPQIICITEPASNITLSVFPENPSEVFNYEWKNESGNLISTQATATVSEPGAYTITLLKTDGTLCERTRTIQVNPSIIATITYDDLIIKDDSDNNTITIITDNLGIGAYEFALDNLYNFQDEPYFDYVEAGNHTLYVQDKNNCGISEIEVSVIGFPKFFTPNNDGFNDTWNVLGLNQDFYPTSKIYIFDRFGKLIITIDPNGNGWDGYYNGEILPSTDYWYSVELTNTKGEVRTRKGHFSLVRK